MWRAEESKLLSLVTVLLNEANLRGNRREESSECKDQQKHLGAGLEQVLEASWGKPSGVLAQPQEGRLGTREGHQAPRD